MIKLSIAVCVYNQENLILQALHSIPEREDIEVVIVNDGSTDRTDAVIQSWRAGQHKFGINYICYPENRGIGYARNVALKACIGEYVGTLDSDDFFYTSKYEQIIGLLDGTDIVYLNIQRNDGVIYYLNESTNRLYCAFHTKCVKRSLFDGLEFKEEHKIAEDWFMNEDLLAKNPTMKFTNITAYHYNWPREGSLCWLASKGKL